MWSAVKRKGEYSEFHVRIEITMQCAKHGTPTECEMPTAHSINIALLRSEESDFCKRL